MRYSPLGRLSVSMKRSCSTREKRLSLQHTINSHYGSLKVLYLSCWISRADENCVRLRGFRCEVQGFRILERHTIPFCPFAGYLSLCAEGRKKLKYQPLKKNKQGLQLLVPGNFLLHLAKRLFLQFQLTHESLHPLTRTI